MASYRCDFMRAFEYPEMTINPKSANTLQTSNSSIKLNPGYRVFKSTTPALLRRSGCIDAVGH